MTESNIYYAHFAYIFTNHPAIMHVEIILTNKKDGMITESSVRDESAYISLN
jgi:hypothetical protein